MIRIELIINLKSNKFTILKPGCKNGKRKEEEKNI